METELADRRMIQKGALEIWRQSWQTTKSSQAV
jgi:hypothetical protein